VVRAPIVMGVASNLEAELGQLRRDGFVRAVLDEETVDLGETLRIDANKTHSLDAVIDRLVLKADIRTRLTDSIELALRTSPRRLARLAFEGEAPLLLSERAMCLHCDIVLPELSTRSFSWNAPEGACATCVGLGDIPIEAPTPEAKKRGKQKAIFDEDESDDEEEKA
jgi:excinuclease ABC subunit A